MKAPVLVIFGPTASGKTALIERHFSLPQGKNLIDKPIEIVSADSMQVYKGMDIGTAKPSPQERKKIPYHLIDIREPNEQFHAGDFVRLAENACFEISQRGSLPVISGGTGFYIKNFIYGLPEAPPSDIKIREALQKDLAILGRSALREELEKADPISASRIHFNDEYRLLRALEVFRLGCRALSSYPKTPANESPFNFLLIGIKRDRDELYKRINERCSAMFKAGLAEEVKTLYEKGYTPLDPGIRAIGYREFFIENLDSTNKSFRLSRDYKGVEALVAQNSRRYAKRQMTFFSPFPNVKWIDIDNMDKSIMEIRNALAEMDNSP